MIDHLDHLVLTVRDIEATCHFYSDILGMEVTTFAGDRKALRFGSQKINLHLAGHGFEPQAMTPTPGSADLCFISKQPVDDLIAHLNKQGIEIEAGPLRRTGATQPILSVYIRDPDGNLLEISNTLES